MKKAGHGKKMIAPVVIAALFLGYVVIYGILIGAAALRVPFLILLALPLAALGAGMIWALAARIKEIRSGEEDDLDDY